MLCAMQVAANHICFKNWDRTSTAMESDIILEGFKQSIAMHGVKYAYLVGDGDSSVLRTLQNAKPYGNFEIQKIECSNHLLRNYSNGLKKLITKRHSSKGIAVDPALRQILKNNIQRLRVAVESAIKFRRLEDKTFQEKVINLRKDIENSICHVFGEHNKCDKYFCKGSKPREQNIVESMKKCGLYNDIRQKTRMLWC